MWNSFCIFHLGEDLAVDRESLLSENSVCGRWRGSENSKGRSPAWCVWGGALCGHDRPKLVQFATIVQRGSKRGLRWCFAENHTRRVMVNGRVQNNI